MARLSPLVLAPPVIFAALAGLFLSGMMRDDPEALPSAFTGRPAPALDLTDLPGLRPIPAEALTRGEVSVVNFWASWCAPCRLEHPQLIRLQAEGLKIYGINYKDDPAKALKFLEELGDPYAAASADRQGRNAIEWGVYGVPETFVIGKDGRVKLRFAGPVTAEIFEKRIRPAIDAALAE